MNLVIDIGNSSIKLAVFEEKKIIFKNTINNNNLLANIKDIESQFKKVKNVIVSCVGNLSKDEKNFMISTWNYYEITNDLKFTFNNLYKDKTLGVDRIALIEASKEMFENQNILAIDMGSCNTYNLITKKGEFVGGMITNGLSMRYAAINKFTKKLPKIEINPNDINIVSVRTQSNINSGILKSFLYELEGFIKSYESKYKNLKIIITGGNSFIFGDKIKSAIFVDNFFIVKGINIIFNNNFN